MANVFQQVIRPVPSVIDRMGQLEALDASALRRRMGEAELGQMQRANAIQDEERAQALASRNAFSDLLKQTGGDLEKLIPALQASGRPELLTQAQALSKQRQEAQAKAAELERASRDDATKRRRQSIQEIAAFTNPQDAAQSLSMAVQRGDLPMEQAQMLLRNIPQDPQAFARWQVQTLAGLAMNDPGKAIEMRMPKTAQRDTGQAIETVAIDPISGVPTVTGSVQKQATPDAVLRGPGKYAAGARPAAGGGGGGGGEGTSAPPLLGVPKPTVTPWANQSNPKDANKVKAKEAERGAKEVEKDEEAARAAAAIAADAKRFLELNATTSSGGASRVGAVRAVRGAFSSDVAEMEGITARLAPAMRIPGSGATSDYDAKMFERGTVGLDKPKETNEAIATGLIARAQLAQDYATFRQTYLEQNGTLQGADRYWKQYVEANPIFDRKSSTPKLNQSRQGWRDYFAAGGQPAPTAPKSAAPTAKTAGGGWKIERE